MGTNTNPELAILGLLAEQPRYGYQVEQEITARGMREWTEIGFSSIYYVLNKLEGAGWLTSAVTAGEEATLISQPVQASGPVGEPDGVDRGGSRRSGPARKVYRLTEAGRAGLRAAVRERLANPRPRTGDFDLALANLPALTPEEARAAMETYRAALQQRLDQVREKWSRDQAAAEQAKRPFPAHANALFDHSVKMMEAEVEWVASFLAKAPNAKAQG